MNYILNEFLYAKHINSFDDLVDDFKRLGYDIPDKNPDLPNPYLWEDGTPKKNLLAQLESLAYIARYNQVPPSERLDEEAMMEDARMIARRWYGICAMGDYKPLYLITKEAASLILSTKLTARIDNKFCKRYLEKPVFVYAGNDNCLFSDVNGILVFFDESDFLICAISTISGRQGYSDIRLRDNDEWASPEAIAHNILTPDDEYICPNGIVVDCKLTDKLTEAVSFIMKFILLLDAEKQPLVVQDQIKKKGKPEKSKQIFGSIAYKKISLTYDLQKHYSVKNHEETEVLDKEGKTLRAIKVSGHIRMQPYGPGWSKKKPIYIAEHESKAWVNDGIRMVKVVE